MNHELEGLLMNQKTLRKGEIRWEFAQAVLTYLAIPIVVVLSFSIMTYLA